MNWMKYRLLYLIISLTVIGSGVFGLVRWGLNLGVDFKGGSLIEYQFSNEISTEEISSLIENQGFEITSVQNIGNNSYLLKLPPISAEDKETIQKLIFEDMSAKGIDGEQMRFETVGPSIGSDLVKKTVYAIFIAAGSILLWIAYQFKSIKYGASAVVAMFHDSLVILGSFSILGHFFGAEIDFLFITALLTILSFSVHDTIVVYDRIRETQKKTGGQLLDIANQALTQTMVRSFNNSMTIAFMLIALILLGGSTVKWFAVALLIGTLSGTYSSPFVSVPLLLLWDDIQNKIKK